MLAYGMLRIPADGVLALFPVGGVLALLPVGGALALLPSLLQVQVCSIDHCVYTVRIHKAT